MLWVTLFNPTWTLLSYKDSKVNSFIILYNDKIFSEGVLFLFHIFGIVTVKFLNNTFILFVVIIDYPSKNMLPDCVGG